MMKENSGFIFVKPELLSFPPVAFSLFGTVVFLSLLIRKTPEDHPMFVVTWVIEVLGSLSFTNGLHSDIEIVLLSLGCGLLLADPLQWKTGWNPYSFSPSLIFPLGGAVSDPTGAKWGKGERGRQEDSCFMDIVS